MAAWCIDQRFRLLCLPPPLRSAVSAQLSAATNGLASQAQRVGAAGPHMRCLPAVKPPAVLDGPPQRRGSVFLCSCDVLVAPPACADSELCNVSSTLTARWTRCNWRLRRGACAFLTALVQPFMIWRAMWALEARLEVAAASGGEGGICCDRVGLGCADELEGFMIVTSAVLPTRMVAGVV